MILVKILFQNYSLTHIFTVKFRASPNQEDEHVYAQSQTEKQTTKELGVIYSFL